MEAHIFIELSYDIYKASKCMWLSGSLWPFPKLLEFLSLILPKFNSYQSHIGQRLHKEALKYNNTHQDILKHLDSRNSPSSGNLIWAFEYWAFE